MMMGFMTKSVGTSNIMEETKKHCGVAHLKTVLFVMAMLLVLHGQCLDQRVVLDVAVLDKVSSSRAWEENRRSEVVTSQSAWGEHLGINITEVDTNIHNPFIIFETVMSTINTTDVIIVPDTLCHQMSISKIFNRSITSVVCIIDDDKVSKTDISNDVPASLSSTPNWVAKSSTDDDIVNTEETSYFHLFSDLSLTEQEVDKLSHVLDLLRWATIMIIYEDSTEFVAKTIVNQVEVKGTQTFLYKVEDRFNKEHLHEVLMSGYNEMLDYQRNFLLLCSSKCAKRVIAQAEAFDRLNEDRTAMHYFSNWLVVSQSAHLSERRTFKMNINNIAILALPSSCTKTTLKNRIKLYLREVVDLLGSSNDTSKASNTYMRQEARKLTLEVIKFKQQEPGNIMTVLWQQNGRELSEVAHINKTAHVNIFSDIFPNRKMGFNKKRFKIGTLPWYPYIIRQTKDGSTNYVGYCIDLLEELAASLNFSYYWKEPDDGEWGRIINDSWTGLVGQIEDKEVEMLVAPLGISSEREMIMDFIFPFIYDYTAVLYKRPDPNRNKWRQLVDPFKWQVLVCIGVSLFSMGIIFWLIEKWNPFYTAVPLKPYQPPRKNFEDTVLFIYGCLLTQGGSHTPKSSSGRMLIAFWWIFSIVMAATYSGNLIAFLTVNKDKPPFETLMDLTNQRDYRWGTLGGSIWVHRFQTSNRTEFKGLWTGIEEFRIDDPDVLSLDQQVHLDKVDEGGYGFIADKSAMEITAASHCDLQFLKEVFYPIHYAIALPNNSPYFKLFSDEMLKVHESGLLQIWKRRWWPRQSMCKGSLLSEAKTIQLIDLQSAFYVIGIGVFSATCSVLIETFVTPRGRKRRRDKNAIES